ncbi:hypothetical protein [Nocardioides marmoraquaticus]
MAATHQAHVDLGTDVFLDRRGGGRALAVRWEHAGDPADDEVTLSLWRGAECAGTFRLSRAEVPAVLATLTAGLAPTTR